MRQRLDRGATLIELLVVLTLIVLVVGLVGPPITARIDNFSLQRTASELVGEFQKAQALSRREQLPVVATYDNREFSFLKSRRKVGSFTLPSSVSPLSAEMQAYVFLPSGLIVPPPELQLQNVRGRVVRIHEDPLTGFVISSGTNR